MNDDIAYSLCDYIIYCTNILRFVRLSLVNKEWNYIVKSNRYWRQLCKAYYKQSLLQRDADNYYNQFIITHRKYRTLKRRCRSRYFELYGSIREFEKEFSNRESHLEEIINYPSTSNWDTIAIIDKGDIIKIYQDNNRNTEVDFMYDGEKAHKIITQREFHLSLSSYRSHPTNECKEEINDHTITACSSPEFKFPEYPPAYWSDNYKAVVLVVNPHMFIDYMLENLNMEVHIQRNRKIYRTEICHEDIHYHILIMIMGLYDVKTAIEEGTWMYIRNSELKKFTCDAGFDEHRTIVISKH